MTACQHVASGPGQSWLSLNHHNTITTTAADLLAMLSKVHTACVLVGALALLVLHDTLAAAAIWRAFFQLSCCGSRGCFAALCLPRAGWLFGVPTIYGCSRLGCKFVRSPCCLHFCWSPSCRAPCCCCATPWLQRPSGRLSSSAVTVAAAQVVPADTSRWT